MYAVDITQKAKKFLRKLPSKESEIILSKLQSIRPDPFRFVKKLEGTKLWRLRVKDYRAILDIIIKGKRLILLRVGDRRNVYQ